MRIAIIGGGIAGLAAAYELEKARAAGTPVEYTLFEARERLGGSLASEIVNGAVLERGPDSFLTEKPAAAELCRELGLGAELLAFKRRGPQDLHSGAQPPCCSARRAHVPGAHQAGSHCPDAPLQLFDQDPHGAGTASSAAPQRSARRGRRRALVERHFGAEAVDRLADPLLSGIYGGDAAQLSARTVLPRLVEMETQYGSLTRGMLAAHRKMRATGSESVQRIEPRSRAPGLSLRHCAAACSSWSMPSTARLDPASLRIATPVSSIRKTADGWSVESGGRPIADDLFDAVIVASPAWAAGVMLANVDPELGEELSAIPYSSSITVNLVYDEGKLGPLPDGFGFLVPASEGRAMLACTFVHRKFLGRTPPGKAVFRAFLGGISNESLLTEPDEALIAIVRRELSEILGEKTISINVEPEHTQVSRWRRAMAQYAVGHQERIARITAHVAALPGLRLAGNAYDGIGIPDCIRLGRKAAKELIAEGAHLPTHNAS